MLVTKCNRQYHRVTLLLWEWGGVVGRGGPRPLPPLLRFFSELKKYWFEAAPKPSPSV